MRGALESGENWSAVVHGRDARIIQRRQSGEGANTSQEDPHDISEEPKDRYAKPAAPLLRRVRVTESFYSIGTLLHPFASIGNVARERRRAERGYIGELGCERLWDQERSRSRVPATERGLICHQSLHDVVYWRLLERREDRDLVHRGPDLTLHRDAADVRYGGKFGREEEEQSRGFGRAKGSRQLQIECS